MDEETMKPGHWLGCIMFFSAVTRLSDSMGIQPVKTYATCPTEVLFLTAGARSEGRTG